MKTIRILLAEDHTIVREGFRKMLELEPDFEVVGEAKEGREAIELVKKLRPHVVLMDIAMPKLNGLEATRQVLKALPETKVLMLSAHNDDGYLKKAEEFGASGFLLKQTSSHDVCRAIRKIENGGTFFYPSEPKKNNSNSHHKKASPLTSREVEVLQLIAEGKANKQTAAELGISIKTVEKHRENLMQKLDIHDTASLTRYAIESGIIESSVQLTIL
jgi:DNA-binding NarL/FixJ family response regulator